jgi:hypothetical protein
MMRKGGIKMVNVLGRDPGEGGWRWRLESDEIAGGGRVHRYCVGARCTGQQQNAATAQRA